MRRFMRLPRKVHFSDSPRATPRRKPRIESLDGSTRLPPPVTVDGESLCHSENCPSHGALTQKEALWLSSLRPWAAGICRRLGLRGHDTDDAIQSAFMQVLSSWSSFLPSEGLPEIAQRRSWVACIVWRCAAALRQRHLRQERTEQLARHLLPVSSRSHECQIAARAILRKLPHTTTPERWRVWAACKIHGVAVEDVAIIEGRPLGTIYNLLRLARKDFIAALRRDAAAASGPALARRPTKVRE